MGPRVGDVFVVGRLPHVTYNPRDSRGLESSLETYLDDRGTLLSLSGATKTGKTVLLRSVAPQAITLSGGAIESVDDMWLQIAEALGLWGDLSISESESIGSTDSLAVGADVKVINAESQNEQSREQARDTTRSRQFSPRHAARRALSQDSHVLVIDDFHYIDRAVQLSIVRGLKDLVFDGLAVILASVPHRAFDAVRVEKEMTGRVTHLKVEAWSKDELVEIARLGFAALNLVDTDEQLAQRLAEESFASPHLMQEFCKRLCRSNGVDDRQSAPFDLAPPDDWAGFFAETAVDTAKNAFDLLRTGPRQRRDRIQRTLKDGRVVDIYGAVLAAIAHTGPQLEISYEGLRSSLREVVATDPPQRQEVTRVLEQMTDIARNKVEGEPVLEYDDSMSQLNISDPYFAFFLRWGEKSADEP